MSHPANLPISAPVWRPLSRRRGLTLLELAVVVAILAVLVSLLVMNIGGVRENAEKTAVRATLNTAREAFMGSAAGPGLVADLKHIPGFLAVNLTLQDLLMQGAHPGYDAVAQRGWRGPYLANVQPVRNTNANRNGQFPDATERRYEGDATFQERGFYGPAGEVWYGTVNDPAAADPWGNPIVLQIPPASAFSTPTDAKRFRYARLVSAGPDGVLDTAVLDPSLQRLAGLRDDGTSEKRGDDVVIFLNRTDVYEDEEP